MAKKDFCKDCPLSTSDRDRRIIAKVGHIKREINTNNRLSEKSILRLKTILTSKQKGEDFNENDECDDFNNDAAFFQGIYEIIEKSRNFDNLDEDQKFWVYELMEWATWNLLDIDPETF